MSPIGKTRKSFADKLRNKVEASGNERNKESKFVKSVLNNKNKDSDDFWFNNDIDDQGKIIQTGNVSWDEALARAEKHSQYKKTGGKRKSRKQRNKSRKQKR